MSYPAVSLHARPKLLPQPAAIAARLHAIVLEWQTRTRGRRELARLTDREIRDLGYSTCDVRAEILKPFWTP